MKKIKALLLSITFVAVGSLGGAMILTGNVSAEPCQPTSSFFGLPTWYKFLEGQAVTEESTGTVQCQPVVSSVYDFYKIIASVLELLLRIAALIAVGFVVYGGVMYILSQGAPDKTKQALNTIISAIVGLVITIIAAATVGFVAGRFTSDTGSTPVPNRPVNNLNGPI